MHRFAAAAFVVVLVTTARAEEVVLEPEPLGAESVVVADGLARDEVSRVLASLRAPTDVPPRTPVSFVIGADGAVREVRVGAGSRALEAAIRRLKFPAPRGGGEVEVRFALSMRWHLPTGPRACRADASDCPERRRLPWAPALDVDTRADLLACVPVPSPLRVEIAVEADEAGWVRDARVTPTWSDGGTGERARRDVEACLTRRVWAWQLPAERAGESLAVEVDFRAAPRRVRATGLVDAAKEAVEDCAAMAWRVRPSFAARLDVRRVGGRPSIVGRSERWPELEACVIDRLAVLPGGGLEGGEASVAIGESAPGTKPRNVVRR